ncbi:MAG: 30S ribosomal protein S6 [Parcubacteria group bacterium]|nr:30S ribosomal protein S6 [Parcubacteria group bacterium]
MNKENKSYQLTCFLSPLLKQEKLDEFIQKLKQIIIDNNGSVQEGTLSGPIKKTLPYKIKKHQEAFYLNLNFLLPVSETNKLCQQLNLKKNIIRYLITIQKQPKENKEKIKSKLTKEAIDPKMIDKIEPLVFRYTKEKAPEKERKVKIKELDKKLDEILNE